MNSFKIGERMVGGDAPCLIMVDAGVNHNNVPERAFELIRTAARAGADVVKFQTYKADTITTRAAPRYWNSKLDSDKGGTQYDTFKKLDSLPIDTYYDMVEVCKKENIIFCSTPFDLDSASFLEELGIELWKISSSDLTYHQLISQVAETGKPVILSTGTAALQEIREAVNVMLDCGNEQIGLQHCMLSYPCDIADANLVKMKRIMEEFPELVIGYSDHTEGTIVPFSAVAMGAKTIEKHYTIDKKLPDSPDHSFSLNPAELKEMAGGIRNVEKSFGVFVDGYYPAEEKAYNYARKSVVSTSYIPAGTVFSADMLTCKRPGTGIYPKYLNDIIGRKAKVDIREDTTINWDMVDK